MLISELEEALLSRFPATDAENWDHVGLSVGRPSDEVARVAVALDVTPHAVAQAHRLGANVLLTHHPVYIKAPGSFTPEAGRDGLSSAALFDAAVCGVSVISLHTNLDRSREARELLPSLVGMQAISSLEFPDEPDRAGFGALASADISLEDLARRCARVFGGAPRIWGDASIHVQHIAFLGGSLGDLASCAVAAGADAVVTGEAGYHVCQDLLARGISVILLGHDRSEIPFLKILVDSLERIGVPSEGIDRMITPCQWWTVFEEPGDRA